MPNLFETDPIEESKRGKMPGLVVVFIGNRAATLPEAIENGTVELGRDHLVVSSGPDRRMSRRHFEVRFDGRFLVTDLGSRNGTIVDGVQLQRGVPREVKRVIRVGDTLFLPVHDIDSIMFHGIHVMDGRIVGRAQHEAIRAASHAASLGRTAQIIGEPGTGKEDLARVYHAAGPACDGPFKAVRCSAIPEGTVDPMLFGAGARPDGYIRAAHGGTLFLAGVAELSKVAQAKLLHLLLHGEVLPLGDGRPQRVDLRICFAAPRELRAEVDAGRLREDLYYRLAAPRVTMPALRDRPEEIAHLLQSEVNRSAPGLSIQASLVEACLLRPWPGNVRELLAEARNAAQAALATAAPAVTAHHLDPTAGLAWGALPEPRDPGAARASPVPASASDTRDRIRAALDRCKGNVSAASRELGIHRTQLRRWLDRFSIDPRTFQ